MRQIVMDDVLFGALAVGQMVAAATMYQMMKTSDRRNKVLKERTDELWFFMNLHKGMLNGIMDRPYL